uniref:COesterase domain-containing protein n=1 Tax=Strongyloides papillosus TaxID=174720 RepID=A0A0N5C5J8_STREA
MTKFSKEFILSTVQKFTQEHFTDNDLPRHQNLLEFIKQSLVEKPSNVENPAIIPNGTIVFKKESSAHKRDEQYFGPFIITEGIYRDAYQFQQIVFS